jgi:signal transduction histidine kinase
VKDQGSGITGERKRRLFQPFYTTRVDGGTGLGLWVSHEIVSRARGTLTFESDPVSRPGTSFIVTLPLLTGNRPHAAASIQ